MNIPPRSYRNGSSLAPPEWIHKGIRYILCLPARLKPSPWWEYGQMYADPSDVSTVTGWLCGEPNCVQFVVVSSCLAGNVGRHVRKRHPGVLTRDGVSISDRDESVYSGQAVSDTMTTASFQTLVHRINKDQFQQDLLRLCVIDHLPFNIVNSPRFRALIKRCTPVPPLISRQSLYRWARIAFETEKVKVKALLAASVSKIHLSFDLVLGLTTVSPVLLPVVEQFKVFIEADPEQVEDLFIWWRDTARFSGLRQLAYDLISISAISAEIKRVFSSTKRLLVPGRSRLTMESIEICELLRNWWLHDLILQKPDLADAISDDDDVADDANDADMMI